MNIAEIREKYPQYSDMSDVELGDALRSKYYPDMDRGEFFSAIGVIGEPEQYDPTEGMSTTDRALAGAGKFFVDTARGVEQLARDAVPGESERERELDQQIETSRERDRPLMSTPAGMGGNIAGGMAAMAPAMFVPGVNTVAGSAAMGGLLGASQPVTEDDSRLTNTALGAGFGAGGQYAGQRLGGWMGRVAANRQAREVAEAPRNAIIEQARSRGYSLPPSQTRPGVINNRLTGFAGKASTQQGASVRNQPVTNRLVRQSLGLQEDQPITPEALSNIRRQAGQMYDEMKGLGKIQTDETFDSALNALTQDYRRTAKQFPTQAVSRIDKMLDDVSRESFDSDSAVELVKNLRYKARRNMKSFDNPERAQMGKIQRGVANEIEGLMERQAQVQGKDDLVQNFRNARQMYAKTHTVEDALTESGDVDARALAKALAKGDPLTGELEEVARTAGAFPKAMKNINEVSTGGSPLDWVVGGGAAIGTGNPAYMAIPALRPLARRAVTSPGYQRVMGQPNYSTRVPTTAQGLLESRQGQQLLRSAGPASVGLLQE